MSIISELNRFLTNSISTPANLAEATNKLSRLVSRQVDLYSKEVELDIMLKDHEFQQKHKELLSQLS